MVFHTICMKKTVIINLHGGPGVGKSTLYGELFSELKKLNYEVEQVPEFAKELVWEKSFDVLSDQLFVFGTQNHRIFRTVGKVDFIVTDSPIILSHVYGEKYVPNMSQSFKNLIIEEFTRYPRFDVYLERIHPYIQNGRNETEEQAIDVDNRVKEIFQRNGWNFDISVKPISGISQEIINGIIKKFILNKFFTSDFFHYICLIIFIYNSNY